LKAKKERSNFWNAETRCEWVSTEASLMGSMCDKGLRSKDEDVTREEKATARRTEKSMVGGQ